MVPNDISILMAALKSHEERAEKKWDLVFAKLDKHEERWYNAVPLLTEVKDHLDKAKKFEEMNKKESINFLWKTLWVPVSGTLAFIGWLLFESYKKGAK